jgi:pimeloyl-ACP methyl ester carboxylesterase
LGGTLATHLASHYPDHISFLFVDRSFGSITNMSKSLMMGDWNHSLFSTFSCRWRLESAHNFYSAKCFKMVSQDPNDDMVDQYCALNTEVATLACNDYLGESRM